MNLFCFSLEGSSESLYEPPYRLKDVPPMNQSSPSLHRPEWGRSDPAINSSTTKAKRNNRRSCVPTAPRVSPPDDETLDKDMTYTCWMDKSNFSHRMKELTRDRGKETQTDLPAQGSGSSAEPTQSTGRLKKLQNLVQTKRGHHGAGWEKRTSGHHDHPAGNKSPVLTCMGLGRRSEKKQPQKTRSVHEDSEEDRVWSPQLGNHLWSPYECPPSYHTCHQAHDLPVGGGTLSLPRTTEWDRFESLIQELDGKERDLSPPQMIRSITDLQLSQNTLDRFDALRQPSPLRTACLNKDPAKGRLQRRSRDRKQVDASPEETLTAVTSGDVQEDEEKREDGGGRSFSKGRRRSLESLYSLNSGQSSSSGVTSGSGCSSNRDSLRLEDDLLDTRQDCGRAVVHTEFIPSPYDTESLKLKVGDVIDIVSKPPMGIWTGVLNGRTGSFKFIYVDVLTEETKDTQNHTARHRSTVQEVLKRLSMEEHFLSLQMNGYQTVDDLMRLREHHLTELNVTDPEHRQRLLAAVDSLQQLSSESLWENEADEETQTSSEKTNCPRDSGCLMLPDSSTEDPDLHCGSEEPAPAEAAAS